MAACTLASCGRIEEVPTNEPETIEEPAAPQITFTATLAPKGEGPQSKAITTGTEGGKEVLNVAWAEYEHIAIYYQKTDDSWATAIATVGTPNPDGSAPITATLTDAKGGTAKFVYPYSLANDGELKTGTGSAFRSQDGTLEYISQYLDAATATGTIDVTGGTATVSGTVSMQNQVCICKFSFRGLYSDATENYYDITIREKDGSSTVHTYITSSIAKASMGAVYMALLGADTKDFTFSVAGWNKSSADAEFGTPKNSYVTSSTGVTLTAGKFYRSINVLFFFNEVVSGSKSATVTIPSGGILTLDGATISVSNGPAIVCEGDATIILTGTNSVTTSDIYKAAIQAGPAGSTLTIQGDGSLTATSFEEHTPAIGCNHVGTCGNIIISGGTINSGLGYNLSTSIGSGDNGTCGNITISGGNINACNIGGFRCGNITICGGTISTDISSSASAGIGSYNNGTCGDILISGGTVTAEGGTWCASIGSGRNGSCGSITITSGVTGVTATRNTNLAGTHCTIGKGDGGTCGTVTIGGKVYYDGTNFQNGGDTYLATSPLKYQP